MIPLFTALAATVAAVTALHLRSRPRGAAAPFPSFQHLRGLAPRRQPAWPLEEPLRWALRVLAISLAAAALFLARREMRRPVALLVEPGSSSWSDARAFVHAASGSAVALTFDRDRPLVEASPKAAEAGERARRTLAACSATFQACFTRAATALGAEALVVSSLRSPGDTLSTLGPFRYVRTSPPEAVDARDEPDKPGSTRVVLRGASPAARIWASALTAAAGEMGAGETEITVADRIEDGSAEGDRTPVVLVPVVAAGTLARAEKVGAVSLPEDAALAAGADALVLASSLALNADASLRPLVAPVLAARGRTVLAAATPEDLGSWAHSPVLMALARVVLFESGRSRRVSEAVPGSHRWRSIPSGDIAPVGLVDVAPGRYERDDGRVDFFLARDARPATPLSDAELASLGGRRLDALPAPAPAAAWPLALLSAALALRLVDLPRRRPLALLLFALSAGALGLLAVDPALSRQAAVRNAALASGRLSPSLPDSVREPDCSFPGSARPCALTARAAFADEAAGSNAVVFPPGRPRVDILSWELPPEIRTGEAALLRVTLKTRRAAGRELTLTVRPTSGRTAQASRTISSDGEALALSVPVLAATEGVSFAPFQASVGEDSDSGVVTIVTRSRQPRRLVLAAAPGWEARAAGEALAKRGTTERITRLGATAVLARGAPPQEPLDRLAGDLSAIDLIVLSGFTSKDLAGAREAALSRYASGGGAILFLGGPPRLSSLPLPETVEPSAEASNLPSRVTGSIGERTLTFVGFPSWKTTLPTAGLVLARLDGAPWIVGRGVGRGRIAAVTAPDAWRAGVPGSSADYEALLSDVVGWLEAGRAGASISLSPDFRSLVSGDASVLLPVAAISGLPVDPVDPLSLLPPGPARERVLARRLHLPFLSADSAPELASLLARIPEQPPLPRRVSARNVNAIWLALCAFLAAEVFLRRRAA